MIGVLITTHGNLGNELIKAAELIKGPLKDVMHVCVEQTKNVEDLKKEINNAIKKLDKGKGRLDSYRSFWWYAFQHFAVFYERRKS